MGPLLSTPTCVRTRTTRKTINDYDYNYDYFNEDAYDYELAYETKGVDEDEGTDENEDDHTLR